MRRYAAATRINQQYRDLTGGSGTYTLGIIQLVQGDAEAALATFRRANTIPFVQRQGEALAQWTLNHQDQYQQTLADLQQTLEDEEFSNYVVSPDEFLAGLYAWVGRQDDAFELLDALIDPPESWGPQRWLIDPLFTSLRADPRWQMLRERSGVSAEQLQSYNIEKLFPGPGQRPDIEM